MENKTLKESDALQKALVQAVLAAMENIAFEEPEVLAEPVEITGDVASFALQVVSPYLLLTRIHIPRKLAAGLTRTIYRDDEKEITDELLEDTVGEFLNTIIGTMMGDLTLGERIFEMGLPQKITGEKQNPSGNIRRICFQIEETPFCVEVIGDAFVNPE